jgi:hypothetical protein
MCPCSMRGDGLAPHAVALQHPALARPWQTPHATSVAVLPRSGREPGTLTGSAMRAVPSVAKWQAARVVADRARRVMAAGRRAGIYNGREIARKTAATTRECQR